MKNDNLKYLSKSMLLEEEGVPRINIMIILTISLTILLFILWAGIMEINEAVHANGIYKDYEGDTRTAELIIPSNKVTDISIQNMVFLTMPGVTNKDTIKGYVTEVKYLKNESDDTITMYLAIVKLELTERQLASIKKLGLEQIEVSGEIITGKRSLLKQFLGPLWDIGKNAASN